MPPSKEETERGMKLSQTAQRNSTTAGPGISAVQRQKFDGDTNTVCRVHPQCIPHKFGHDVVCHWTSLSMSVTAFVEERRHGTSEKRGSYPCIVLYPAISAVKGWSRVVVGSKECATGLTTFSREVLRGRNHAEQYCVQQLRICTNRYLDFLVLTLQMNSVEQFR
jgi:hypothetical protein